MKAFPALTIAMRLVNQEEIRDYWSTDEVLSTPFFSQIMPRDKFMNILTYFHFCDNDNNNNSMHNKVGTCTEILPMFLLYSVLHILSNLASYR